MNAPAEVIEAARAQVTDANDIEVFDDCAGAVALFQRMGTQWRTRGMDGEAYGLDYAVFEVFAARVRFLRLDQQLHKLDPAGLDQVFEDIGLMEIETLKVLAERRANR